jgi:hypothetical protein
MSYLNNSNTPTASARMPLTTLMLVKLKENKLINPSRISQIDSTIIPNRLEALLIISSLRVISLFRAIAPNLVYR